MIRPDAGARDVPLLDEDAVGALAQLPSLRKVGFHDCSVTAAGMARLVDLPNLTSLRLYHTSVELGGIAALADAPHCGLEIWLERLSVMHQTMPQIARLRQLETFFLSGTANSADLSHLVGLTNLKSLTLDTSVDNLGALPGPTAGPQNADHHRQQDHRFGPEPIGPARAAAKPVDRRLFHRPGARRWPI